MSDLDWRDQEVRNEARARDRNEWIENVRGDTDGETGPEVYVFEFEDARYSVVQKIAGRPARIARMTDLRHRRADLP